MRKITILGILLEAILLSACGLPLQYTEVHGSGQLKTETRQIASFDSVDFQNFGTLIVEQGDRESLEITAEDNVLKYLQSKVTGNNLTLGVKDYVHLVTTRDIVYHLTVKNLKALNTSGIGNVEIGALQTANLRLGISGSGSMTISSLQTGPLDLEISGSGSMEINDLQADSLDLKISGLGDVTLAGEVQEQNVQISGSGSYEAGDLLSRTARIGISGSGSAVVWAEDTLDLDLSGNGNLSYYGEPVLNMQMSGMGQVQSLGMK